MSLEARGLRIQGFLKTRSFEEEEAERRLSSAINSDVA